MTATPARTPLIAGNWKMHKTVAEAGAFIEALLARVSTVDAIDIAICPAYPALTAVVGWTRGSPVSVYAQNMHHAKEGPFTGELSAPMLIEAGVRGVILGHSERRRQFGESDRALALKVAAALEHGLVPILCIGESEQERERGETARRLRHQVQEDLARVDADRLGEVVIAYEPVWAIGTGRVATPDQAQEAQGFIRALLADRSSGQSRQTRVLAAASSPRTRPGCSSCPTWTGCSSAPRASTRTRSRRSSRRHAASHGAVPAVRPPLGGADGRDLPSRVNRRALTLAGAHLLARAVRLRLDLDSARAHRLGLRDSQGQHAVGQGRVDRLRIEPPRNAQRALEAPKSALDPPHRTPSVVLGVRKRPITADREDVVLELNLEVVRPQPRHVHVHGDSVIVDQQVGRGDECAHRPLIVQDLAELTQPRGERLYQCRRHCSSVGSSFEAPPGGSLLSHRCS